MTAANRAGQAAAAALAVYQKGRQGLQDLVASFPAGEQGHDPAAHLVLDETFASVIAAAEQARALALDYTALTWRVGRAGRVKTLNESWDDAVGKLNDARAKARASAPAGTFPT